MLPRILLVDDDRVLLSSLTRTFRGRFELDTAESGAQALALGADGPPYAAIVADLQMPGMSGIELLREFGRRHPETTRIMLTGKADLSTAMEAVNLGHVFRFLAKPCAHATLEATLDAGVAQYRLVTAERVLLEETLTGSIETLVELLSLFDPVGFSRSQEVRGLALQLAEALGLRAAWDLGLAASLARIGRLAVPLDLQARASHGQRLSVQEQEVLRRVPEYGSRMVAHIPRLQSVARIILYSAKDFDGEGYPADGLAGAMLPLESRVLKVAAEFVDQTHAVRAKRMALAQLRQAAGRYDPDLLDALEAILETELGEAPGQAHDLCEIEQLRVGMVLAADILAPNGLILLTAGTRLSGFNLQRLRSLGALDGLGGQVLVQPA